MGEVTQEQTWACPLPPPPVQPFTRAILCHVLLEYLQRCIEVRGHAELGFPIAACLTRPRRMENEVLIIGAGPSGLFAAADLARPRRGRAADRARGSAPPPGAGHVDPTGYPRDPGFRRSVAAVPRGRRARLGLPRVRSRPGRVGAPEFRGYQLPLEFLCSLPQYETERILETHLAALGGVVERGVTATKAEPEGNGVRVELLHGDGSVETVHPDVVIVAGEAHCVTHESIGEPLEGDLPGPFPRLRHRDAGAAAARPVQRGLRSAWPAAAGAPAGRALDQFPGPGRVGTTLSAEDVIARIKIGLVANVRHRGRLVLTVSDAPADRRRLVCDRRFLIGDAADLSSPFGGEGLNAGLHDAYALAWKLVWSSRRGDSVAARRLCDVERLMADRHVLEVSDQVHRGSSASRTLSVRAAECLPRLRIRPPTDPAQRAGHDRL